MAEEDGDLDGVFEMGVTEVEPIEGPRRNAMGSKGFIASSVGSQRELEGVKMFASGSK